MKSRQEYHEPGMTAIFKEYGAFFAFSQNQYNHCALAGVEYSHVCSGLYVPKAYLQTVEDALAENAKKAVQQDLAENGIHAIVERELRNHEYGYTWDITDTLSALADYDVTAAQVKSIADSMDWSDY